MWDDAEIMQDDPWNKLYFRLFRMKNRFLSKYVLIYVTGEETIYCFMLTWWAPRRVDVISIIMLV